MDCIYCGNDTKVTNSRPKKADNQVWRRRKCLKCGAIVTSIEQISLNDSIMVKKRGGNKVEPFLRNKLFLSIYKAVDHLDDPIAKASYLTITVLRHLQKDSNLASATITSAKLASITSEVLKHYNSAAQVRYLSFQTKLQLPGEVKKLFR